MANTPKIGDPALDAASSEPSTHPADPTPSPASQATSDATDAPGEPRDKGEPGSAPLAEAGVPELVEADTTARAFGGPSDELGAPTKVFGVDADDFDEQTAPVRMPHLRPEPADDLEPAPEASTRRSRGDVDENAKTQIFTPGQLAGLMTASVQPAAQAEPPAQAEPTEQAEPSVPASFDALELPEALREAVTAMGWDVPTAVQIMTFPRITAGRDLLVQSQTGSGKTGAFCLPWLAQRFEADDAARTGVQLLVLTPTRELAKQVCEQLEALGRKSGVRTLPVYGGTAMQPQLQALREGVHAVVGTPGRILDHIRRRSLRLDRVRMVVLDEADEMLSMGFLEDIHAILDACPTERQTCLFSATVPPDIERIARRYMHSPESVMLSGDQVAAAEIHHAYYTVSGTLKVRDLIDMIALEEPANALVFCNTREETYLVASALRREGCHAEPLSSDLTQSARERVMGRMRSGQLRFLVATDVASRGIDISHIGHVINYSFPENAESYVHRTGRTGRAGRPGQALSLIAPQELGNFYYLKLQYPSITFEERSLPPSEELSRQRLENKLDQVSRLFPELVAPEWTLLTRALVTDPRGEQVVAYLLKEAMTRVTAEREREQDAGDADSRRPRASDLERPRRGRGRFDDFREGGDGGGGGGRPERDGPRGRGRFGEGDQDRRGGRFGEPEGGRGRFADAETGAETRVRDEGPAVGEGRPEGETRPEGAGRFEGEGRRERGPRGEGRFEGRRGEGEGRRGRFEGEGRRSRGGEGEGRRGRFEGEGRRSRGAEGDEPRAVTTGDEPRSAATGDEPRAEGEGRRSREAEGRGRFEGEGRRNRGAEGGEPRPVTTGDDDRGGRRRRRGRDGEHGDERAAQGEPGARRRDRGRFDEAPAVTGEVAAVPLEVAAVEDQPTIAFSADDVAAALSLASNAQADNGEAEAPVPERSNENAATDESGRGRRRRRRRRRGGRDEVRTEGETDDREPESEVDLDDDELAGETTGADVAPLRQWVDGGEDSGYTLDDEGSDDQGLDVQTVEATAGSDDVTDPGTLTGVGSRRRRRRRRRRGGQRPEGTGEAVSSKGREAEADEDDTADDLATDDEDDESAESSDAGEGGEGGDGRRRRRRRRGGRRRAKGDAAPSSDRAAAPVAAPVVPPPSVSQDQIVIDIDEEELDVVRDEFGEIDELDDLTLKGRRRGVMESLQEQEEVELEDLSDADRDDEELYGDDGTAAQSRADAEADANDGPSTLEPDGDTEGDGDAEAESDEDEDPREAKKRKRRRRRRNGKKKAEPAPPPELTAPPHKDFWEVWAAKFSYRDFEDDTYLGGTAAVVVDEPEPAPVRPRERDRDRDRDHGRDRDRDRDHGRDRDRDRRASTPPPPEPPQMPAVEDETGFVRVRLNVGRKHGKKAAHIRELLAETFGLARKAVRDLTVGEASTRFRLGELALARLEELIVGFELDGISLTVARVEGSEDEDDGVGTIASSSPSSPITAAAPAELIEPAASSEPADSAPVPVQAEPAAEAVPEPEPSPTP